MTKILVGCGGWSYFNIPNTPSLEGYSKAFNFVEVNSTFYEIPSLNVVASWRSRVPEDFEFAVRCNRKLTHELKFKPTSEAVRIFKKMLQICRLLKASVLHFQTSPTQAIDHDILENASSFLTVAPKGGPLFAWEIRGPVNSSVEPHLLKLMRNNAVIHAVDISKGERPKVESDVLYTRLFSKGIHNRYQFTDEEITDIISEAKQDKCRESKIVGHRPKMYADATRIKLYLESGKFSLATGKIGLESLASVLAEDAYFPTTKEQLIAHQGWKVFDLNADKRVRIGDFLQRLPNRTFRSIDHLIVALR